MNAPGCDRIALAELTDYAAGELPDAEAAAIEDHLFSCADCGARAHELDALLRAIGPAIQSATVGGFVTDAVLNQLSRDGVRVRSFALTPGAIVPCAVWDGDDIMALRLRADFSDADEITLSHRVAGTEVRRTSGHAAAKQGEIIFAVPAAAVRQLPVVEVDLLLTARRDGQDREIGRYTLLHGGALRR
jgi:anti-sigma factor RsiW